MLLTGRERCRQLRPVAVLAALNLGKFTDQLPAAAVEVVHHGLALRLQAKAALALPVSRDPEVSDEFAPMCRHTVLPVVTVVTSREAARLISRWPRHAAGRFLSA